MNKEINGTRVRAYAKLLDGGVRTIDEIQEDYRVAVYVECIAVYEWTVEGVDIRYREAVEQVVGTK